MPRKEQTISISDLDTETALAISYQAAKDLGWDVLFGTDQNILAQTVPMWNVNPRQILVNIIDKALIVSSETTKNELVDLNGRNNKNIKAFLSAFETAKKNNSPEILETNKQALITLRAKTAMTIKEKMKEAEEMDKVMNMAGSNLYITYGIMAINVLIFILMAINGAGIIDINGYVHIKWGSNYGPLTLTGDWWRLVTNVFLHFGIIHLAMNMYCLYIVGVYLEPMLGKTKYIAAYLCTGVLASLASLWWHKEGVNSAGTSGAIFGLYGLFLALLTTNLIPQKVRKTQLQSIGIFVAYNLIYGMKGGVDNAAHIGGLVSGFIIGYLFAISIKREKQEQRTNWVLPIVLIITVGGTVAYLNSNKGSATERTAVLNEVKAADYKDGEKFNDKFNEMVRLQDEATLVFEKGFTDEILEKELTKISLPLWNKAELVAKQMQSLDISIDMHKKADAVLEYVTLRKKEIQTITDIVVYKADGGEKQLEDLRNKMNEVLGKLK